MQIMDWVVIAAYVVVLTGVVVSVRRARSLEDFSVASRQIPGSIIFATLAATYIGPGYSMGLANKAATQGFIWLFIFFAFSVQTLLVGIFVAPRIQKFRNARTIGGIMGRRYGTFTQALTGFLTLALLTGFVGVMSKASADIISSLTGMPFIWAAILSTTVVIGYSTFGGVKADIASDILHFVILGIGIPLVLVFLIADKGLSPLISSIPPDLTSLRGAFPPAALVGLFLAFLFGETLIPPYVTRALAAKSPSDARRGFVLAAGFGIAWFIVCVSIGVLTRASAPIESADNAFIYAVTTYAPVGVRGLVIVALAAIIMSSWDSLLNCASVSFHTDILSLVFPALRGPRAGLLSGRALNVIIGVGATLFAINVPGIVEALLYCYTLWAPTVVMPLIIASMRNKVSPFAGPAAIIAGGLAAAVWEWGLGVPWGLPSVVVGLAANQLAFWSVQLLVPNTRPLKGFVPTPE